MGDVHEVCANSHDELPFAVAQGPSHHGASQRDKEKGRIREDAPRFVSAETDALLH